MKFEYTSGCLTFVLLVDGKRFDGEDSRYCYTKEEQNDIIKYFKEHANPEFLNEYYNQEYWVPDDYNAMWQYVTEYGNLTYCSDYVCECCGDCIETYEVEL